MGLIIDFTLHESILVIVSVLVTTACFNIAFYFGYGKKLAYLFFAFYCLFHCFKIYLKTYPNEQTLIPFLNLNAYQLVYLSVILGMLSLSIFLAHYFSAPHKIWFILSYLIISVFFFFYVDELEFIKFSLLVAIAQSLYATVKTKKGYFILLGLLGFAFCVWLGWQQLLTQGYFTGAIFLILCMVLSSSIELAKQNREYQETRVRASRLENQLLKTTIQPHFILNSLTSLQELIEQEPERASRFIQELSKVFELFAKISHQKLIPIHDEISLISSYLDIMSARKDVTFRLRTENLSESDDIPPGVFLTVIENGITHGYENKKVGVFTVSKDQQGTTTTYTISNDGNSQGSEEISGTGFNYIISRLQESYQDKFQFESNATENGWISKIMVWK